MKIRAKNTTYSSDQKPIKITTKGKEYKVVQYDSDLEQFVFIGDDGDEWWWNFLIEGATYDYDKMFNLEDMMLMKLKGSFNES